MNTIIQPDGQILTGKAWRQQNSSFKSLPFHSNIPRMDEMAGALKMSLAKDPAEKAFVALLVKFGQGLDDVRPFSYTEAVENLIRDSEIILSPYSSSVSAKNASRIWAFFSKFVMLDRFATTFGLTEAYRGISLARQAICRDDFGGATKLLDELNPPTKIVRKFLQTWGDRERLRSQYVVSGELSPSKEGQEDAAGLALTLSRRLIGILKVKKILNIEAGLELVALGVTMSSENSGVFPETAIEVDGLLRRIWLNRLEPDQFEELSLEMQLIHKSMKNVMEYVFSASPLLALSTTGWSRSIAGSHLLKLFIALGNDRPPILKRMEDEVLQAIIGISTGKSRPDVMDALYSGIKTLEKELATDEPALRWFDFSPPPSDIPSTPPAAPPRILKEHFAGGLASPPQSNYSSPQLPVASILSTSSLPLEKSRLNFGNFPAASTTSTSSVPQEESSLNSPIIASSSSLPQEGSHLICADISAASTTSTSGAALPLDEARPKSPDFPAPSTISSASPQFLDLPVPSCSSSSALPMEPSPANIKPTDPDVPMDLDEDELGQPGPHLLSEARLASLPHVAHELNSHPRSRKSSLTSLSTDPSEMELDDRPRSLVHCLSSSSTSSIADTSDMVVDGKTTTVDKPRTVVQSGVESEDSDASEDDSDSENGVETVDKPMTVVQSGAESEDSESSEDDSDAENDGDEVPMERKIPDKSKDDKNTSVDSALAAQLADVGLRRSSRNKQTPPVVTPLALPTAVVVRKPVVRKDKVVLDDGLEDASDNPKLSDLGPATFHPTLYADISGWGSTVKAGANPYRHVPVQIVRPGNVASTGDDTDTLRKVEALIQSRFKDGLPPHLQPNASSRKYVPGSDQSRIFVSSHAEFSGLDAVDVQAILRHRLILVHGHTFDYDYGWDLPSLGRLYDVEKNVTVLVSSLFHPYKPEVRHHQGTLRQVQRMTSPASKEQFPPLNALSLPANRRNLFLPCQFGSFASHEVAQSRLPLQYAPTFGVPDLRPTMEWSIVGGKGAISPFHIDSDGMGTVVVVAEGTKYWIVATKLGDHETISNVDSLGPEWTPYSINDGAGIDRFRFEAVHLRKGDMLIMPPGVPHWVLSTSNAICVGRHFYASSTIRLSVLGIVHCFFLGGSVTNEDHLETRTLLYQLLVFWSMRLDQTDVDGGHIPLLSSEEQFLDMIYLGIFVVLSPAFDRRFYSKPPPTLVNEFVYAVGRFHSLLHVFSQRFLIFVGGIAVAASYVVDRIVAEFSAAAVVFASGVKVPLGAGNEATQKKISFDLFVQTLQGIVEDHRSDLLPYFSRRIESIHKDFFWTGPQLQIIPRTEDNLIVAELMGAGELLDLPGCPIYPREVPDPLPLPLPPVQKRHRPEEGMDAPDAHRGKRKH